MINPFVSICMITYNHEKYIKKAIEGVIQQCTKFDFELVIGDDFSTDNTNLICQEYYHKYSNRIRLLNSEKNIGVIPNFIKTIEVCKSKYIALCEGDDYWIDMHKLQKQVDFLETNPDYAMVYTDIILVDKYGVEKENSASYTINKSKYKSGNILFDLLEWSFINTCTVCIRNDVLQELIQEVKNKNKWYIYDRWLWLQVASKSKIRYFDEKTSAYRVHGEGLSQNTTDHKLRLIKVPYIILDAIWPLDKKVVNSKDKKEIVTKHILGILFNKNTNLLLKLKAFRLLIRHRPPLSIFYKKLNNRLSWK